MAHETLEAFDHESTLLKKYRHWAILLRKKQITLGSLVLVVNEDIRAFKDLPMEAYSELHQIIGEIEYNLKKLFNYEKINYLALMMVDPQVHYHIIPRYSEVKTFGDLEVQDHGWPGLPKFDGFVELEGTYLKNLREHIITNWETI